ncbi:MAG TPA: TIM barrel protein, partial [Anaerolineae bacterium]
LDTGHVLSGFAGDVDLYSVVDRILPRLAQVHLHDAPQWRPGTPIVYGKDHQPLGAGNLDVGRLLDQLAKADFKGPLIFELEVHEAVSSLHVLHQLRPNLFA